MKKDLHPAITGCLAGWLYLTMVLETYLLNGLFPSCCLSRLGALIGVCSLQANQYTQKGGEHVKYIGVDVGKNRCQACITDQEGKILDEFRFTNDAEGIKRLQERGHGEYKAVVESKGNLWLRIYEALEGHGAVLFVITNYNFSLPWTHSPFIYLLFLLFLVMVLW